MAKYPSDSKLSNIHITRRLSINSFTVRVYLGPLSDEHEYVTIESEKSSTTEDVVSAVCRKLLMSGGSGIKKQFELAEVFSSGGQLCKERRLDSTENPVALQLLWPRTAAAVPENESGGNGLFDGYRFYLRRRDPVGSFRGWISRDQSTVDSFLLTFLLQPMTGKEFPDLCSLPDLNEHTLLHNLKARFNQKNIYTYVGSILIAVNPFKFFPIYNPKYVSMYQNKRLSELPPHIFAVADAAYHSMLRQKQTQCIVISGESGSGKTESTNLLLHHLTALSHKGLHGSGVEQTILGAGPVLEAFGNAKTVHNNNSSRFGKFIQVNYKQNGMVHGAIVEKYLLEKSRIVFQAKEERNYHVFYYLLAGADEKEKDMLCLYAVDKYNYLSQSICYSVEGVDEQHEFARLKQSMEMVGFSHETQKKIFSVLSAVLHLGNVNFKKKGDKHHDESVTVENEEAVRTISTLLKVKEQYVLEALTQKKTTAGDETFIINYKMEDAIATRDAMAKCIYGALFDWIVLKVNQALLAKKHDSEHEGDSIGVLDIFGFEDFGSNSFEQFCINYANEHLQYYFNQHIFKFEQEEYQREGIQWKNIEFIDNTGSLELFSKRPNGLFCLLDDECSFPAATNDTLLNKFKHHNKCNPYYQVPQLREEAFSIMHYAGRVKYFIKDFRKKNLDLVRPEIVATLKMSSLAFVRELMGIDPVAVLRWSVVRALFRCFFAFIKAGEAYRKKNRKNDQKHPYPTSDSALDGASSNNLHEQETNLQQLKDDIQDELTLYTNLENSLSENDAKVIRKARKLLMKNKSFRPKQRPSLRFHDIKVLKAVASRTVSGTVRGTGNKKQPPTVSAQFQWSLSSLMNTLNQANPYFIRCIKSNEEKAPCIFDEELVMRQLRYTGMLATVKIRQSGYNYRLVLDEFIHLYKILLPKKQRLQKEDIRNFLISMSLREEHFQIGINKIFLRESEKMKLDEALHSAIMQRVITIQRWVKTCLERQAFLHLRESTIIIQQHIRRFLVMQDFQKYQLYQFYSANAVKIQTHFRCYIIRQKFLAEHTAIIYIQSCIRAVLARRRFFNQQAVHQAILKEAKERKEKERIEIERQQQENKLEDEKLRREEEKAKKEAQKKELLTSSYPIKGSDTEVALVTTTSTFPIDTFPAKSPIQKPETSKALNENSSTSRVQEAVKSSQRIPEGESSQPVDATSKLPAQTDVPRKLLLSNEKLREIEAVLSRHPDLIKKKEESGELDAHAHLSPLHKAKRQWRNWVGSAKKRKDDSEEESEDSVSSYSKQSLEITGISVLPMLSSSTLKDRHESTLDEVLKSSQWSHKKQKKKQRRAHNRNNVGTSRSNMKVARSTEWQYAENMVIKDNTELSLLDDFISQKQRELYKDVNSKRSDTVFDKIFKGSLEKFRMDLKSMIAVEINKENCIVRYRDLFEKFRHILEAEMKNETTDALLVMSVNAFRGFLDEFRKQEEIRSRENRKDDRQLDKKTLKREKLKKVQDIIEFNGHRYQQFQFSIPTFCEVCASLIWIMDKAYVCLDCKLACHKKCYSKQYSSCKGAAENKNQASSQLFGTQLSYLVSDKQKIPLVCERLMSALEKKGLFTEGVYRKPGAAPKVKELKAALETDVDAVDLEEYHVHVLASALKLFLRNLPEPLLTFDLYDDFLRTTEIKDEKELIRSLFEVLRKLPKPNFDLFERVCFHLAWIAMHSESNKMSANALAVIFAPVVLGTNKKLQAQDAIALVPQQMMCIELILKEQISTMKSKFEDIDTLEIAEKTTGERLSVIRASLQSRQRSPVSSPARRASLSWQDKVDEESLSMETEKNENVDEHDQSDLAKEEKALTRHLQSIHREKDKITYKLPLLETRQASSDEDILSGDETDSLDADRTNSEYGSSFDLPAQRPTLMHITKKRAHVPNNRQLPHRFARRVQSTSMKFEDTSEACLPEPIPTINIKQPHKFSNYFGTMTVESSYMTIPEILAIEDDDEIMV